MVCRSFSREQIATIWSSPDKSTRSTVTSTPSTRVLKSAVGSTAFSLLTVRLVSSGITDRTCWRRQSPTEISSGRSVVLTPTHHGSLLLSA